MNTKENSIIFLNYLYELSTQHFRTGAEPKTIARLMNIERDALNNITDYLFSKRLITDSETIGGRVALTDIGIDVIENLRAENKFCKIHFIRAKYHDNDPIDGIIYTFFYEIENEKSEILQKTIQCFITSSLALLWGFAIWKNDEYYTELKKILLFYSKEKIIEKIKEGTLLINESLELSTENYPEINPLHKGKELPTIEQSLYLVELGKQTLIEQLSQNKIAAEIIEYRDYINNLFKEKFGETLLSINQERQILELFKTALSQEDLSHRLSSLAHLARNFNNILLRKLTSIQDRNVQSVELLNKFISSYNIDCSEMIDILRNLGKTRQGYPIHDDHKFVIRALKDFNLDYPTTDYNYSWQVFLSQYQKSLKILLDIIKQINSKIMLNEDAKKI